MSLHKKPVQGFTLIEVLVTVTLSAIAVAMGLGLWQSMHASVYKKKNAGLENLGNQASYLALQSRFQHSRQFLWISEDRILWKNATGNTDTLSLDRNQLFLNSAVAMPCSISHLAYHVEGPRWNLDSALENSRWKHRDLDRSGWIDAEELDVNYSHSLDSIELSIMSLFELTIVASDGYEYRLVKAKR
jgi:prepilin-type N-terminal cleavage/methylation domain-containing protein